MAHLPLVSVLVPSYNHAQFLSEAIGSVIAQTMTDWELIAIDDGSQDDSLRILKSFEDLRITVGANSKNLGTYGTLQEALGRASGEFVAILNSDDKWEPSKLDKQLEVMRRNTDLPFVYSLGRVLNPDGTESDPHGDWPKDEVQDLLPRLLEENRVLASSVLFRRTDVQFDPRLRYSGDWEALLRPCHDRQVGFIREPLCFWRMHDRNSFVRSPAQLGEEIYLRKSILANVGLWLGSPSDPAEVKRGLSKCSVHLSALYVAAGKMTLARAAAIKAVSLKPSSTALRRLVQVCLPGTIARARLSRGRLEAVAESPFPMIDFAEK